MSDARKVRLEALAAIDGGNWKKALERYSELEKLEPEEGIWAQKAGDMARRLGQTKDALGAYDRAVDRYAGVGALVKAIAVCKLILEIDPKHSAAQNKLAAMHGVPAARPATPPPPPPPRAPASAKAAPLATLIPEPVAPDAPAAGGPRISASISFDFEAIEAMPPSVSPQEAKAMRTLPKTPLFSALTQEQLRAMIDRIRIESLKADQVLFTKGQAGDALYVVSSGELSVRVPHEVARLGEGSFVGEIALLADQPRAATVVATQPTEVLVIDRATVQALVAESPPLLKVFVRFLRDRAVSTLLSTSPLFRSLSGDERVALGSRFRFGVCGKGAPLLQEGKASDGLYILLAGGVSVVKGGMDVANLAPGDAFGEMSLLNDAPATATAQTTTQSFLLQLPRADFAAAVTAHPAMRAYLTSLANERTRMLSFLMI